jgi:hypothetical protein
MKIVLSLLFVSLLLAGTMLAQSAVSCQDGLTATVKNAVILQVDGAMLAKKPVSMVLVFSRTNRLAPGPGVDDAGGYKGYFFENNSGLKINGQSAKLADLRKILDGSTIQIHMLVPNGACNGWHGLGTFTSIEVIGAGMKK